MIDRILNNKKPLSSTPYYVERINENDSECYDNQILTYLVTSVNCYRDYKEINNIKNPLFRLNSYASLLDSKDIKWSYDILTQIEKNDNPKIRANGLYGYLKDYHRRKNTEFDQIPEFPECVNYGGYLELTLDNFLTDLEWNSKTPNLVTKKTKQIIYGFLNEISNLTPRKNNLLHHSYKRLFDNPIYVQNIRRILFIQRRDVLREKKKSKDKNKLIPYNQYYDFLDNQYDLQDFVDNMRKYQKTFI
jgi:hypothetical protein